MTSPTPAALAHPEAEHDGILTASDRRTIARRVDGLRPYAAEYPGHIPSGLRPGYTRPEWMRLTIDERLAALYAVVREEVTERRRESLAATPPPPVAPAPASASAPTPEDPDRFEPGTAVVLCARDCGAWLRARPGRPVRKACRRRCDRARHAEHDVEGVNL